LLFDEFILISLWLIMQEGSLVERRFHQRKWKWVVHGRPQDQNLTSITPALQDESAETSSTSLFFTTSYGFVFEYRIPKQSGLSSHNAKTVLVSMSGFFLCYISSLYLAFTTHEEFLLIMFP